MPASLRWSDPRLLVCRQLFPNLLRLLFRSFFSPPRPPPPQLFQSESGAARRRRHHAVSRRSRPNERERASERRQCQCQSRQRRRCPCCHCHGSDDDEDDGQRAPLILSNDLPNGQLNFKKLGMCFFMPPRGHGHWSGPRFKRVKRGTKKEPPISVAFLKIFLFLKCMKIPSFIKIAH